ncbi:serine hydrolase domain-containing protein [Paucibacter sp. M5-1]|uniref:serine hydrolase domain-containing protein n=1 Tax=Paucibacter sp. M5-1 TaxID=3015998 RepID=UPI0022B8DEF2|nr:serine hydrolase domain-containing protein [Paucibacter sp. M5-1]MCZ7879540.1 serine hydrolase [Paucibacter sp. M5-1]
MTSSDSSPSPTGLAAVDALLQPFNRSDAPGLVVGIARAGRTVYRRGVGLASIEQSVAMSPHTRVRIASTSKQFTCLAVLLLAEDGLLDIDDLVYRHLPELPLLHPAGPTLRQLMHHTGGWRTDLAAVAQGLAILPKADWSKPLHEPNRELNFEPGTRMIYSNTGYQLLARVIERLSGQRFEDFMRERIFTPLGMHDTESLTSDLEIRAGMAMQYQAQPAAAGGGLQRGIYPGELRGSGSLVSTIDDMLCWLAHLRSPKKTVGSAASWAQMIALPQLSTGMRLPYALGLMRHDYRGVEVIHHAGAVLGATSQMITVPAHQLDIMIMVNGAPISPVALGFQIIDALLGEALVAPPAPVPAAAHAALLGQRYHAASTGAVFGFEDAGGKLALNWMGSRGMPLRQIGNEALLPCEDSALNPLGFALEELGGTTAPDILTLNDGGHLLRCERLPDVAPISAALAPALAGRYRVPDLQIDAHVEIEGEGEALQIIVRLQGRHGHSAYRLQPLSPDVLLAMPADALFAGMGGAGIINIDRAAGRVSGLRLDAPRLRRLRFIREEHTA